MFNSPFDLPNTRKFSDTSEVIFVSDMFVDDYVGGAELTTQALIDSCPLEIEKLKSSEVSLELLEQGQSKFWVFGNFAAMNTELIPSIVANMNYAVVEYDYKYCRYRSPEKHLFAEQVACNCHNEMQGKMISAFYYGAKSLWWMSEQQEEHYHDTFQFLKEKESTVLSSVFDDGFFASIKILREKYKDTTRKGWIVLGSTSWIKGANEAEQWCKDNDKDYETLWGLEYGDVLEKLAQAEGFVYLPVGMDTCPRMVIEAKLLGCELHLNDYVQHKDEIWFDTDDDFDTEAYLYAARDRFWRSIKSTINWTPTISGYTTTRNCIEQKYPFEACINSMLAFADEVVVVDGGSTDGTYELLENWATTEDKLKVFKVERDWQHPRHAVFDGAQKAEARLRCTSEFLWQMDSDEIVHEQDYQKIPNLCMNFPEQCDLVSLPVIEYWGSLSKIRCDINPWKWRLSRNKDYITHGIPSELRRHDESGNLYSHMGTDGCDYIHVNTFKRIPHGSFYTAEVDMVRRKALEGDSTALNQYQEWFQNVVDMLPGVHHYSWYDIERKIKTYKNYWQRHWESLYDVKQEDTPENNMFFDKSWSDVTDEEITTKAKQLADKTGGHVFHSKFDPSSTMPHVSIKRDQPEVMNTNEDKI